MPRHLILWLEAPLMAFGGVTIDNYGYTRDFPARSMLTGLLANALGWDRTEGERLQRLQERLVFAARIEREGAVGYLRDTQNAQLSKSDRGWTTRGQPEGRAGASYDAPHRRFRDYLPDALVIVALRLEPPEEAPNLETVAQALECPARPLFIGRKPCLPSAPLLGPDGPHFIEAETAGEALARFPRQEEAEGTAPPLRAMWPPDEAPAMAMADRVTDICDERNWISGLHEGRRPIAEGRLQPAKANMQEQGS